MLKKGKGKVRRRNTEPNITLAEPTSTTTTASGGAAVASNTPPGD